jgi:hypothetical protein
VFLEYPLLSSGQRHFGKIVGRARKKSRVAKCRGIPPDLKISMEELVIYSYFEFRKNKGRIDRRK